MRSVAGGTEIIRCCGWTELRNDDSQDDISGQRRDLGWTYNDQMSHPIFNRSADHSELMRDWEDSLLYWETFRLFQGFLRSFYFTDEECLADFFEINFYGEINIRSKEKNVSPISFQKWPEMLAEIARMRRISFYIAEPFERRERERERESVERAWDLSAPQKCILALRKQTSWEIALDRHRKSKSTSRQIPS